jgi:DNA-binding beta-propeller fold protein YncE
VIQVFTLAGDFVSAIEPQDGFDSPGGVAVRSDGSLLVADTYAKRIVHLAPDGKVLRIWGGAGEFSYPTDVANTQDGGFYVADGYNDRIQQFDAEDVFVRKWGGPFGLNIYGPFNGWFTTVTSVAIGPADDLFVADFYNDRIQKFTPDGRFITAFGTPSQGPGHTEIAVAVDSSGNIYSANFADNRIEKWIPAGR